MRGGLCTPSRHTRACDPFHHLQHLLIFIRFFFHRAASALGPQEWGGGEGTGLSKEERYAFIRAAWRQSVRRRGLVYVQASAFPFDFVSVPFLLGGFAARGRSRWWLFIASALSRRSGWAVVHSWNRRGFLEMFVVLSQWSKCCTVYLQNNQRHSELCQARHMTTREL